MGHLRQFSLVAALCAAQPVWAQEPANGLSFRLGVGIQSQPEYFGAEDSTLGPAGDFKFERLQFGSLSLGGDDRLGFDTGGSFRFVKGRSADDYDELAGLDDVDPSLEIGGGLRYTAETYKLFANLRYGVVGHESLVAEFGGDIIYRPTRQITLTAGPRVLWGSDEYTQTYFGVSSEESAASAFDVYEPSAGIVSAGLEAEATYEFNDTWGVTGTVRYDQLRDDAAGSPITQSEDQLSGSVVITRRVTFGF